MSNSAVVIGRLSVFKDEPGLYRYALTCEGQAIFDGDGYSSIREAIEAGSDLTGPITALEVAYGGVTAGTFTLQRIRVSAEEVAQHAVDTYAAVLS